MRKLMLMLIMLLLPAALSAAEFELKPGLRVTLPDLAAPWVVTTEPTPALVEHLAEHLRDDAARQGRAITEEQAQAAARKRLANNELMVYNENSEAHLLISFSPIGEGEADPSKRAITRSAKYAADGVTDEGWSDVKARHADARVKGAQYARYFEIDYTEDGEPGRFMGIVGYARPYWFWLYGNDHLKDPADRAVLQKLLREIEIRVAPAP